MSSMESLQQLSTMLEEEIVTKQDINVLHPHKHPHAQWFFQVVTAWVNHPEILDSCVLLLKKSQVTRDELMDVLKIMHGLSRSTAQRRLQMMENLRIITEIKEKKLPMENGGKTRPTRPRKRYRLNQRLRKKFKQFLRFIDLSSTELTETKEITTYQGFNILYQEIRAQ